MSRGSDPCAVRLQRHFGPGVLCEIAALEDHRGALLPEEHALVAHSVPARQHEFAVGRTCARRLLACLEFAPAPLLRARDRSPLWPRGAIGSITHSDTFCAVAVARAGRLAALGLDTEPDEPIEAGLWSSICTPRELAVLSAGPAETHGRTVRLLFSAKESTFKCLYPLTHEALELHDVEVELDRAASSFRAFVHRPANGVRASIVLAGFHVAHAGALFTGATLPNAQLVS